MFIKFYKSAHPIVFILLCLLGIVVWIGPVIYGGPVVSIIHALPVIQKINLFSQIHDKLSALFAFLILLAQSFYLNYITTQNEITQKNSYITALIYFTIMSISPQSHNINQVLICNCFLLPTTQLLLLFYDKEDAFKEAFYVGILIALCSLFYFPAILFLLFIFVAFIVFRLFNWREWIIIFIGTIVPYIFVFTYYFWHDGLSDYFAIWQNIFRSWHLAINLNFSDKIIYSTLSIVLLFSFIYTLSIINERIIILRKILSVSIWFIVFALIISFFSSSFSPIIFLFASIPASIIIANYFSFLKKKWWSELLYLILFIEMIVFKFI